MRSDGGYGFTAKELKDASCGNCIALFAKYRDERGRRQKVQGDLAKVREVENLSGLARRNLSRVHTVAQTVEGTNEVHTLMQYDTHEFRIAHGVPLFVTLSPHAKHTLHMIRFSRARAKARGANIAGAEMMKQIRKIEEPALDVDIGVPTLFGLLERVPDSHLRRAIIAWDARACVDGFRTIVLTRKGILFRNALLYPMS